MVRTAVPFRHRDSGPEIAKIAQAAARHCVNVVLGVNERSRYGVGTVYNTLVTFGDDGRILGRHRKLVPTWAEKLTWAPGDALGPSRAPDEHRPPRIAGVRREHQHPGALRPARTGELIHVASYIALPVAPPDYDMAEAIRLRAAAHSFEGKVFTVVSCSTVSEQILQTLAETSPKARELLSRRNSARFSGVVGPDGPRHRQATHRRRRHLLRRRRPRPLHSSRARCTTSPATTTASTSSSCA